MLIERLTSEEYEENDYGGLPDLIESIKLQDSGPTEASRAIRKKLYLPPALPSSSWLLTHETGNMATSTASSARSLYRLLNPPCFLTHS